MTIPLSLPQSPDEYRKPKKRHVKGDLGVE